MEAAARGLLWWSSEQSMYPPMLMATRRRFSRIFRGLGWIDVESVLSLENASSFVNDIEAVTVNKHASLR
jgi:hypothetical protein